MARLVSQNHQNCIDRPVDWRWQRAGELLRQQTTLRRDRDQEGIKQIMRFRNCIERATTSQQQETVLVAFPTLYTAWSIYIATDRQTRWEIEARILAKEDYQAIATKVATTPAVITAYEQYFFNVSDRLESQGYITHRVIGPAVQAGMSERQYDLFWKLMGYWHGPQILDALIYTVNDSTRPATQDGNRATLKDDFAFAALNKAVRAMRTCPINDQTRELIFMTYTHLLDLEKEAMAGGMGNEMFTASMGTILSALPWQKHELHSVSTTAAGQLQAAGVGIRANEFKFLISGTVPPAYQQIVETARFPEKKNNEKDSG